MTAADRFRARAVAKRRPQRRLTFVLGTGQHLPSPTEIVRAISFISPSVETSAASTRSGDVDDAVGAHPDAARVALPRAASGTHH